eukprot:772052-Pyramimonas_sp.AAC.1
MFRCPESVERNDRMIASCDLRNDPKTFIRDIIEDKGCLDCQRLRMMSWLLVLSRVGPVRRPLRITLGHQATAIH